MLVWWDQRITPFLSFAVGVQIWVPEVGTWMRTSLDVWLAQWRDFDTSWWDSLGGRMCCWLLLTWHRREMRSELAKIRDYLKNYRFYLQYEYRYIHIYSLYIYIYLWLQTIYAHVYMMYINVLFELFVWMSWFVNEARRFLRALLRHEQKAFCCAAGCGRATLTASSNNVGKQMVKRLTNHPSANGWYHLLVVIWGMVYDCSIMSYPHLSGTTGSTDQCTELD